MSALRAELLGETPDSQRFRMVLPPGWEAYEVNDASRDQLLRRAGMRLAQAHRPDLFAELGAAVERTVEQLKKQNAVAFAIAGEASPTWSLGTASLIGVVRSSGTTETLDAVVRDAIVNHSGVAIGEGYRLIRWTERRVNEVLDDEIVTTTINYLLPVPGSKRARALQWSVTVPHAANLAPDAPVLLTWIALFDGHVATFEWVNKE